MANVMDLMTNLYDMLAKQFGPSSGGGTFLQIGWPGVSLSPADFKPFNNPNGPYDANCAEETVSFLANIAPACNALKFENSGFEIDDLYQIVIAGAVPKSADPHNLLTSPAYKLFSDAQYEFVRAQKGSTRDPTSFYYPCKVTPIDWFTEESAQRWNTLSLAGSQVKPASKGSPFVKLGGQQLVATDVLKIPPAGRKPAVLSSELQAGIDRRVSNLEARVPVATANVKPLSSARMRLLLPAGGQFVQGVSPLGVTATPSTMTVDSSSFARRFVEVNATRAAKTGLRPSLPVSRLATKDLPAIDTARFDIIPTKNLTFNRQLYLRNVLAEQLEPKSVAITTDAFSISFKYCLVTLDRSWLKAALLSTRNWYMLDTKAGEYSKGRINDNPGMFPMIPSAFIAIRDLKIVANWSRQDAQTVAQSKSFGPFDIRSGTFNQGVIEAKQLQVIAWLSRLTPSLPPSKDPALS